MQDRREKNNKVWLITPAQEVLAQGNRGDAALLGNDWSFGLCWSMWRSAFCRFSWGGGMHLLCEGNTFQMEGSLFRFLSRKQRANHPAVDPDPYVQALHTGDSNWMRKGKKEWLDRPVNRMEYVLVDLNQECGTPLFVLSHFTLCLVHWYQHSPTVETLVRGNPK